MVLFIKGFINLLCADLCCVDLFYNAADTCVDIRIAEDLLAGIDEKYIRASGCREGVFLLSPAFTYASFEEVSLDSPLEHLFRHGNHNPVFLATCTCQIQKTQPGYVPVLSFGKQLSDAGLAAQSFFLRKSIRDLRVHLSFLIDKFRGLWPLMALQP